MSWLRLDDSFDSHPKIVQLGPSAWLWLRVLLYCSRYRTGGRIPVAAIRSLGLEDELCDLLVDLRLLHEPRQRGGADTFTEYIVNDWDIYNGGMTGAERMRRMRDNRRETAAKTVTKPSLNRHETHGGPRGEYGSDTSSVTGGDEQVTHMLRQGDDGLPRAPVPVPLRTKGSYVVEGSLGSSYVERTSNVGVAPRSIDDDERDELVELLGRTDWSPRQLAAVDADPVRTLAWLRHAWTQSGLTSPSGFAWKGLSSGEWPVVAQKSNATKDERRPDPSKRCAACGEKLGYGHADDCPTLVKAADSALAELPSDVDKAEMAKHAATLLESLVHKQAL